MLAAVNGCSGIFHLASPCIVDQVHDPEFDGFQKEAIQMVKPAKGTTSLAFIFKDGVMVVADSRASMGGYICKLLYNVYPIACIYEVVVCFAP
ncbi:hypothetical protein ACFX11_037998 [Malus domestica]